MSRGGPEDGQTCALGHHGSPRPNCSLLREDSARQNRHERSGEPPHRPANPQNRGRIKGFCFKSPSFGLICYAAVGNQYEDTEVNSSSALVNRVTVGECF